jgi:hypothetical protein
LLTLHLKTTNLNQIYTIKNNKDLQAKEQALALCVGKTFLGFSITNQEGTVLQSLVWHTGAVIDKKTLTDFFDTYPELTHSFSQVKIAYNFSQSMLVPFKFYREEESGQLLKTLHLVSDFDIISNDRIAGWQICNVFAVPEEIYLTIKKQFPQAQYVHQHTVSIHQLSNLPSNGSLQVNFDDCEFSLIAENDGQVLLAQTYSYKTPADVLFQLLSCCQQYNLQQEQVKLILSGLITQESALYKELYQYFIHIGFAAVAGWQFKEKDDSYPPHFFTPLNQLATCVL